ncbi:MAG: fatty acid--CoA ligase [Desulfopila sp.]|jgi:fatty-acyl-CoA synthase|nr:fatty acid--CoA ligase [Desulfopila sp.]
MTDLIQKTQSAYSYPLLVKNLLQFPVKNNPGQEIVFRGEQRFTYAQFRKRVCRLAHVLVELGVRQGDTVAVMDWDSHRYLECFFAIPMIGAVLHTVNIKLSPEQILYTINHAEDDYILVNEEFLPLIEQIRGRIDMVKGYMVLQDKPCELETTVPLAGEYETLLAAADDDYVFPDFDENSRATTFYTTGTTGMPKGVFFSHRQLVLHTLGTLVALSSAEKQGRFHQGDVYMPITPMFHVHAWGFPYIATFAGIKQVYPGKYMPGLLLQLIDKEKVTFSHCVPTILHMLINDPSFKDIDLSRWKIVIGGAAMPKALCRVLLRKGADIFAGYGMSETCPVLSLAQVDEDDLSEEEEIECRCKTGRALPLVDLRVVDSEMTDVPLNGETVGEIVVRAPWLTQAYLKDKRNSEVLWKDGYLHTGDVANIDAKGSLSITDRIKDVIKIGGEWLSSLELEDVITLHDAVKEVAVIGKPDEKWGERPLALVVAGEDVSEKELVKHVQDYIEKGMLSKQALLLKVTFVESIDKTSVGKINKRLLRQKYVED